jgi:hypothetical protein
MTKKKSKVLPEYQAFATKDRLKSLQIKRKGEVQAPAYAYLLNVISDDERGEEIALIYSFMLVKIRGKHLQEVAQALIMHQCHFISEYNPDKHPQPEPSEPLISSIEIVVTAKYGG